MNILLERVNETPEELEALRRMNALLERNDVTPEELEAMPERKRFELIDGRLVERHMSTWANLIAGNLISALGTFCAAHKLGYVLPGNNEYQCFPWAPRQVRKPDVSFIRRGRLTMAQMERGFTRVAPDLAVEVVSPNDLFDEIDERLEDFLRAGTALVWVVSLKTRLVYVHRANGSVAKVRADQELDGEDVLPGFRCRVASLFPAEEVAAQPDTGS